MTGVGVIDRAIVVRGSAGGHVATLTTRMRDGSVRSAMVSDRTRYAIEAVLLLCLSLVLIVGAHALVHV